MHIEKPNRTRTIALGFLPALIFALLLACAGVLSPATRRTPGAPASAGAAVESVHGALGLPEPTHATDEHVLVRTQYVLAYSPSTHGPAWVSWRLGRADLGGAARHKGHFITDTSLPAAWGYRVTHDDYTNTHYQRGHLLPSDERTASDEANESTFLLSNVEPQTPALNDGPWKMLEKHCRGLVEHDGRELYIVAGPIFGARPTTIGHGVPVPDAFFKAVIVLAPGQDAGAITTATPVIATVMPNADGIIHASWSNWKTTLHEVETRAGYRLFGRIPAGARTALEGDR